MALAQLAAGDTAGPRADPVPSAPSCAGHGAPGRSRPHRRQRADSDGPDDWRRGGGRRRDAGSGRGAAVRAVNRSPEGLRVDDRRIGWWETTISNLQSSAGEVMVLLNAGGFRSFGWSFPVESGILPTNHRTSHEKDPYSTELGLRFRGDQG